MQILDFLSGLGGWAWLIAGLVMLSLELGMPGGYFLWLGVAGIVTGLASLFQPIPGPFQFLVFGLFALVSIFGWLRYTRTRPEVTDRPMLNRRAERFIGQVHVLSEPIREGFGRINLDDTVWRIAGPDLSVGMRVRIIGHEGAVLRVVPD